MLTRNDNLLLCNMAIFSFTDCYFCSQNVFLFNCQKTFPSLLGSFIHFVNLNMFTLYQTFKIWKRFFFSCSRLHKSSLLTFLPKLADLTKAERFICSSLSYFQPEMTQNAQLKNLSLLPESILVYISVFVHIHFCVASCMK